MPVPAAPTLAVGDRVRFRAVGGAVDFGRDRRGLTGTILRVYKDGTAIERVHVRFDGEEHALIGPLASLFDKVDTL